MIMEENRQKNVSRREFLRRLGMGAGAAVAMSVMEPLRVFAHINVIPEPAKAQGLCV
jgi:hypothetical protein